MVLLVTALIAPIRFKSYFEVLLILAMLVGLLIVMIFDVQKLSVFESSSLALYYIPFTILTGYLLSNKVAFHEYMNSFERVISYLALISLVSFFVVLFFPEIVRYFYSYTYYGFSAKTVFFLNVLVSDSYILMRNCGIASEPGLYQYLLNLALWWRIREGKLDIWSCVLVLSIISTNSTAGLAIMVFLLVFCIGIKRPALLFVIFAAILFFGKSYIGYHLEYKLVGSASFNGRFEPMLNSLQFLMKRPMGIGNVEYSVIYKELNIGAYDSFSQVGLRYGVFGVMLLCFLVLALLRVSLLLGILVLITLFSQMIWNLPIVSALYFWAVKGGGEGYVKS